jgi:type IV pilus assembly protein PilY1
MRNVTPLSIARLVTLACAFIFSAGVHSAVTDIASAPVITSAGMVTPIPPNLMFVLDDSGSMDWDFLPDWSNDNYCKRSSGAVTTNSNNSLCCRNRSSGTDACMYGSNYASTGGSARRMDVPMTNSDFNFAYYNPAIRYQPPKNADGTSRISMTSPWTAVPLDSYGIQEPIGRTLDLVSDFPDVEWCTDNNFTNCRRNSNYFYPSNYYNTFHGVVGNPFYYNIAAGEYCDSDKLTNCRAQSAPAGTEGTPGGFNYPAKLRWCSDTALTTCQGIKNATYQYPRYPTLLPSNSTTGNLTVVLVVSGNSNPTNNKSFTVNTLPGGTAGPAIITAATAASNNVATVADNIIARIGNGYVVSPKTCTPLVSPTTCTITVLAPASGTCPSGAITPTTSSSGTQSTTITLTVAGSTTAMTQFSGSCRVPGNFERVDIVPATTSYPKSSARSDCAATTGGANGTGFCTYPEEMTNFANWFTYYRTRMQMMKTSTSLAFSSVGDNFRVGYMSINNNTRNNASNPGDFLNITTFDASQKASWYNKLFAAIPSSSTPLRSALSTAGLIYGGVLNGQTFNGSTVVDPVLYSCQNNFTLLSTDGYWNTGNDSGCDTARGGAGCKLDKTSAVGNTDAGAGRPYADGGVATDTAVTPIVTTTVVTTPRTRVRTESRTDTAVTTGRRTRSLAYTGLVTGARGPCSNGQRQVFNATATATRTGTTITTVSTPYTRTTTTSYSDGSTTISTVTRTVVTTNGVVTSDTTSVPAVTGPTAVSTVVSGPTTTAWVAGTPTTDISPETTADSASTWTLGAAYDNNSSLAGIQPLCVSSTTYPTGSVYGTPTGPTLGAWSGTTTTGPVNTTGAVTGNNVDTPGTANTVVTGPTTGTTTTTSTSTGGVSDSLADVAYYYYSTDLRVAGSTNPVTNRDVGTGEDFDINTNTYKDAIQRMSTYTLGLGIDGYMKFRSDYKTASSGDYFDIFNGNAPSATVCTWQTGGQCNWPTPSSDSQANIDDLWHAAVSARGEYFSARSPAELAAGIGSALNSINAKNGAAAAATTSNPNISTGDNFLFSSDYRSKDWYSHLQRLQIDPATGNIVTEIVNSVPVPKVDWEAGALLDAVVNPPTSGQATRKILTLGTGTCTSGYPAGGTGSNLKAFCWDSLTPTEQNYFQGAAIATLPQFCATGVYTISGDPTVRTCLDSTQQTDASGKALVDFLRGDPSKEDQTGNTDRFYRDRIHTLGDIISSEALYVKTPLADYQDASFQTFKLAQAGQTGMVYVAANDGMLHAFNAETGAEAWAYVPTMAMPSMFNLASMNYGNDHKFILDGTPVVGYADLSSTTTPDWKAMLVGGLGGGGVGFYALDITDRANPAGMWEFKKATTGCAATVDDAVDRTSDCDLGISMGNPVVAKLMDGRWVVLVTSGYNNTTPGNGQGYLYVLNAKDGKIIRKIGTGVGSSTDPIAGVCATAPCPSGLSKIAAWVDNPQADPTVKRVYGGDLFGNLWRFDVNDNIGAAGYDAQLLTVFKGPTGTRQSITARPDLGVSNGAALVLVGTGRLLGDSDKASADQISGNKQSFYGIKDPLTATGWVDTRQSGSAGVSMQTVTVNTTTRSRSIVPSAGFDLATQQGWGVDLPDDGELANTDPTLVLGTVVFTTNVPKGSACTSTGESFIYNLDYRSGGDVAGGPAGEKLGNALATRPVVVQLPSGAVRAIVRLSDTTTVIKDVLIGGGSTNPRRVSWRQLINE